MKALILVDLQNDFFPGGSLPVKDGFEILPAINELLRLPFDLIVATKDWHPPNHGSFAATHGKKVGEQIVLGDLNQILWPIHCVQNTHGSELNEGWDSSKVHKLIYKGTDPSIDSYSTFFDNGHLKSTGLDEFLKENRVKDIYIAGLATDYCVKYSVLDALKLGYQVHVVTDGCRGVNLAPNDSLKALSEMEQAGALLTSSSELKQQIGL